MKIIYLGHHALGDVIMKVPAIRYLVKEFGQKNIYFTVRDVKIKDFIVSHTPLIEQNIFIHNKNNSLKSKLNFILKLRTFKFDYFILPPTIDNRKGKLLFKLSKSKRLISHYQIYLKPRANEVYIHKFKHKLLRNLEFIRYFKSWDDQDFHNFAIDNYYLDNLPNCNITNVNQDEKFLLIHPGSGGNFHKRFPVNKWKELVSLLRKNYPKYRIYISGSGQDEKEISKMITAAYKDDTFVKCIVDQFNLEEFMTLINNCKLFISADCGPCHLASIMKKQSVTVFGPTDFDITGPFTNSTVVRANPSILSMPQNLRKKYGDDGFKMMDCFESISSKDVLEAIKKNLE